ncbi:MAG: hypothetical protein WCI53_12335 [Bacteroidota bacterium]
MKILAINSTIPNYVVDGLIYGLKKIDGIEVVDIPRMDFLYKDATFDALQKTGNRGATLYGLLDDVVNVIGKRTFWQRDIEEYDLILFCDIASDYKLFNQLYKNKKLSHKLIIIDGYDSPSIFPFFSIKKRLKDEISLFFKCYTKVPYFKREFETCYTQYGIKKQKKIIHKILNYFFSKRMTIPISMSIPANFIDKSVVEIKSKSFVDYNVDPFLTSIFNNTNDIGIWKPVYASATDYIIDLNNSKFGITTKRAGWDCLRHYEYAAKGVILCFKNLHDKPSGCAPFGLSEQNSIVYSTEHDLIAKIELLGATEISKLLNNSFKWVENYSCEKVATYFLQQIDIYFKNLNKHAIQ